MNSWYACVAEIEGRGLTVANLGGLAGLAFARKEHIGQFFTPAPIVRWMWEIIETEMDNALSAAPDSRVSLLDTSAGSGRLLQFANPEKHTLAVIEPDLRVLDPFLDAASAAGFKVDFYAGGLEDVRPADFSVALINPPYSLTLQTPHLVAHPCTCHGPYGPNTSTRSHEYAVAQAMAAAAAGVAVLPFGFAEALVFGPGADPRFRGIYTLPHDAFAQAGARVRTALVIWGKSPAGSAPFRRSLSWGDLPEPEHGLGIFTERERQPAPLSLRAHQIERGVDHIGMAVTGDARVRVNHAGRRLVLAFDCGLVKARVLNALLRRPVKPLAESQARRPEVTRHAGQGVFDLDLWHTAPDGALAQLQVLCNLIGDNGGIAQVDPGLPGYLARAAKRRLRDAVPFRRFAQIPKLDLGTTAQATTCIKGIQWDARVWGSPVIRPGTVLESRIDPQNADRVLVRRGDTEQTLARDVFDLHFAISDTAELEWRQTEPGLAHAFPQQAAQLRRRLQQEGLATRLWGYQQTDLMELLLKGRGIGGMEQGYGKTYLAFALAKMRRGRRPALIVTEPYLLNEFRQAARDLGLADSEWKIIRNTEDAESPAGINVTTYPRIRAYARRRHAGCSLGKYLRRRFSTLIVDEGESLSNPDSRQSRALRDLCATEVYALTGTPIANYTRGLLPLLQFIAGDGTSAQPYGRRRAYFDPVLLKTNDYARRGTDVFRERHVVMEWTTREFAEELRQGGKREIPKVNNPELLRAWIAPWILRRVKAEPELAPHHAIAKPDLEPVPVSFADAHLLHYLTVADDFAQAYRAMKRDSLESGKRLNMTILLRRLEAVIMAANQPWRAIERFGSYHGECRKVTKAVALIGRWIKEDRKVLVFTRSPGTVAKLVEALEAEGIQALGLSGTTAPEERGAQIDARIKKGDTPVLIITYGAGKRGINLPQASAVLLYEHSWTARDEDQAMQRVVRSAQSRTVEARVLEFEGSIDTYMANLVAMKRDSAAVVLDAAEGERQDDEFESIDAVLFRFVESLKESRGVADRAQLKEVLRNAA